MLKVSRVNNIKENNQILIQKRKIPRKKFSEMDRNTGWCGIRGWFVPVDLPNGIFQAK